MDISLRLDTLGVVDVRYLRGRERYRDWPSFQLMAASRQAQTFAFMTREVAEQLHQQILVIEDALGLNDDDDEEEEHEEQLYEIDEKEQEGSSRATERESASFSPTFAQALKQLNELARQRLGEPSTTGTSGSESEEAPARTSEDDEDIDALEQLQDAFTQMMEVVRELAEEMSTDALKITGRFKCARTHIEFVPRAAHHEDDDDDDDDEMLEITSEGGVLNLEVELVMILQLFEEGRSRADDLPAVELQLEVEDFERLHATLDYSLERERRSRRRRS